MPGPANLVGAMSPNAVSNAAATQPAAGRAPDKAGRAEPQPFARALDNRIRQHGDSKPAQAQKLEANDAAAAAEAERLINDPAAANPAEAAAIAAGLLAAGVPAALEEEAAVVPVGDAADGEEGAKPLLAIEGDGTQGQQRPDAPVIAPGAAGATPGAPEKGEDGQFAAPMPRKPGETGRAEVAPKDSGFASQAPALRGAGAEEVSAAARSSDAPVGSQAQPAAHHFADQLAARMAPAQKAEAPQFQVPTPASQPRAWAEDVGNRIVWMAGKELGRAELILTPPHLGRVEISLSLQGDHASASFVAATPAAREALEQALPRLRELMTEAGINLSQTSVSANNTGQQGAQEQHWTPRGNGAHAGTGGGGDAGVAGVSTPPRGGNGLVDTFA